MARGDGSRWEAPLPRGAMGSVSTLGDRCSGSEQSSCCGAALGAALGASWVAAEDAHILLCYFNVTAGRARVGNGFTRLSVSLLAAAPTHSPGCICSLLHSPKEVQFILSHFAYVPFLWLSSSPTTTLFFVCFSFKHILEALTSFSCFSRGMNNSQEGEAEEREI